MTETTGRPGAGGWLDTARDWAEPLYISVLYAFAAVGLLVAPRRLALLALAIFAYQSLAAAVFMGATRYRVPWDFLVGILAVAGAAHLARVLLPRARRPTLFRVPAP